VSKRKVDRMKRIYIDDEHFQKYEEDFEFDKSEFETEQEIEVMIPFEGYLNMRIKCKNPQVAMAQILKINRDIGILSCVNGNWDIEDINERGTYAVIVKK